MGSIIKILAILILVSCGKSGQTSIPETAVTSDSKIITKMISIESDYSIDIEYEENGSLKTIQCQSPCNHSWITNNIDFKLIRFEQSRQRVIIKINQELFEDSVLDGYYDYRYVL